MYVIYRPRAANTKLFNLECAMYVRCTTYVICARIHISHRGTVLMWQRFHHNHFAYNHVSHCILHTCYMLCALSCAGHSVAFVTHCCKKYRHTLTYSNILQHAAWNTPAYRAAYMYIKEICSLIQWIHEPSHGIEYILSLIHIWRCRRVSECRSRWSPYH